MKTNHSACPMYIDTLSRAAAASTCSPLSAYIIYNYIRSSWDCIIIYYHRYSLIICLSRVDSSAEMQTATDRDFPRFFEQYSLLTPPKQYDVIWSLLEKTEVPYQRLSHLCFLNHARHVSLQMNDLTRCRFPNCEGSTWRCNSFQPLILSAIFLTSQSSACVACQMRLPSVVRPCAARAGAH